MSWVNGHPDVPPAECNGRILPIWRIRSYGFQREAGTPRPLTQYQGGPQAFQAFQALQAFQAPQDMLQNLVKLTATAATRAG
jgi:hypothetical protein